MPSLSFISDDMCPGEGASAGIPRGLLVRCGGMDMVQEGLGLGTVALRRKGTTYFPRTATTRIDGPCVTKEFTVDSALVLESPVLPLSRLMPLYGLGTRAYMMLPRCQEGLLDLRERAFSRFKVRPTLRETAPLAAARFTYLPRGNVVTVRATVRSLDGALPTVFIMNELGADRFTAAIRNGDVIPAPTGWCPLTLETPTPALLDRERGTTFLIDRLESGSEPRLFWGRERREDLCWAGFELEICGDGTRAMEVEYDLRFGEANG